MRSLILFLALAIGVSAEVATPGSDVFEIDRPRDGEGPELFGARPGEPVLVERLRGVRFVNSPAQLTAPGFPSDLIDVSLVPELNTPGFIEVVVHFHGKPVSQASLRRLVHTVKSYMGLMRSPFTSVYLPPQDITDGYVQVVINDATVDGEVAVNGAKYFSPASFRSVIRQQPGKPIDKARLDEDIAWLNRNPYRQVRVAAAPGGSAGTTRLELQVEERLPWNVSASYDNTGSQSTDENRISAGITWANALGRGDQMTYRFIADPDVEHSKTHAASYTAFLPWRHIATFSGSYSSIESIMIAPFTQHGTSWQTGLRYEIPLRPLRAGWTQNLVFTADFKYSDNNLEFAAIPITNNVTHVAQLGASYGVSFPKFGGQNSIWFTGYASPGGLTRYNKDGAFDATRPGARAEYAYGTINVSHQRPLANRFAWISSATLQVSSGALLGSEQLNGGGSYAVRGYRESSAFGDEGIVANNELHAPAFALFKGRDTVDLFAFADFASLHLDVDHESTDLRSVGVGVNYQFGRQFSLRAS
jgi:hemolysin activation/secretion protein